MIILFCVILRSLARTVVPFGPKMYPQGMTLRTGDDPGRQQHWERSQGSASVSLPTVS